MSEQARHRILMIGDRAANCDGVYKQLSQLGFPAVTASSGTEGLSLLRQGAPDLVVTVLPLPDEDGLALCRKIRAGSAVPVIIVGSMGEPGCVNALEAGADDYLDQPLNSHELAARIRAAIRRAGALPYRPSLPGQRMGADKGGVLQVGEVFLDLNTCRATVRGSLKTLTPNEFRLMAILMRTPDEVFTREDLRQRVWPDDHHSLHLVEVHIANLRSKIEIDPHRPNHIVTVRSRGYKFAAPT